MQTTQTTGARLYAVLGLLFVSSAMVLFLPFFPPGTAVAVCPAVLGAARGGVCAAAAA